MRSRPKLVACGFVFVLGFGTSLCATPLWCRLEEPPYILDIQALAKATPIVFRGQVVDLRLAADNPSGPGGVTGVAEFRVDRVYRGHVRKAALYFVYSPFAAANGHDCINFKPLGYWLVFARENAGRLELADDCHGALSVSPLLGPTPENEGWLSLMEADFMAGMSDSDPASRLVSIQRLGGLGLPSSRDALHRVVATGDKQESGWAVYALLRTGDTTVLPQVKELLRGGDRVAPESAIALELRNVADERAAPDLIAILQSAPGELTTSCVLMALGENLKDPRAVPVLAAHLSDPDRYARYDALDGLRNLTHENACTLPRNWREQDIQPQISKCKAWWKQQGRFQSWTQ